MNDNKPAVWTVRVYDVAGDLRYQVECPTQAKADEEVSIAKLVKGSPLPARIEMVSPRGDKNIWTADWAR